MAHTSSTNGIDRWRPQASPRQRSVPICPMTDGPNYPKVNFRLITFTYNNSCMGMHGKNVEMKNKSSQVSINRRLASWNQSRN